MYKWKANQEERLLTFIKRRIKASTRDIRWCIEHNRCTINGHVERFCSYKVQPHQIVNFFLDKPASSKESILFEDAFLIALDKPADCVSTTLASRRNLHLVHRLDRDTTGLILFAKTKEAQKALEELFFLREIQKEYLALVEGFPGNNGTIVGDMACATRREGAVTWKMVSKGQGMLSKTLWECKERGSTTSLIRCFPHTGRTHQIRVHFQSIGHPLLGDSTYGSKSQIEGLFRHILHATSLSFIHPFTQQELSLNAPLPTDFLEWKACRFL